MVFNLIFINNDQVLAFLCLLLISCDCKFSITSSIFSCLICTCVWLFLLFRAKLLVLIASSVILYVSKDLVDVGPILLLGIFSWLLCSYLTESFYTYNSILNPWLCVYIVTEFLRILSLSLLLSFSYRFIGISNILQYVPRK